MSDPRTSPSIFTRGAVDLGALRDQAAAQEAAAARQEAARQAAAQQTAAQQAGPGDNGAPAGSGGVVIVDVTEATFQSEVVERSMTVPVVIDFWAEWCGPCKQLSPVLEKLAREGNGSWVLAKVDVEANPRLAQMFRVQGIPMVYAVVAGQPVDTFTGVVPEAQLRPWIEALLRAAGSDAPAPEDPALLEADDLLADGDLDGAERAYKKILSDRPAEGAAESGLAQVALLRRVQGTDVEKAMAAAETAPDDIAAQSLAADIEVMSGLADQAYNRLIGLVRRTAGEDRERVRQHLISLFSVAGPDDPTVAAARRALASALF
jgi:putative thioredoxin